MAKKDLTTATIEQLQAKAGELGIELKGDETPEDILKLLKAVSDATKNKGAQLGNHGKGSVARVILNDGNSKHVLEFCERDYGDKYVEAAREQFAAMKASRHTKGVLTIEE